MSVIHEFEVVHSDVFSVFSVVGDILLMKIVASGQMLCELAYTIFAKFKYNYETNIVFV